MFSQVDKTEVGSPGHSISDNSETGLMGEGASRTETDQASAILSDPVCGPLLGQPQETNTIKMIKKEMKSNENGNCQCTEHTAFQFV